MPKGLTGPVLINKIVHLDLDKFDQATFDGLSDKIKDMIKRSPEYALVGRPASAVTSEEEPPEEASGEEVPF